MPRVSRQNLKTITATYHIILRGINKQEIFIDNIDRQKFLKIVKETKGKFTYNIYLYVLMDNHVHIVINDEKQDISQIIHKLCTTYALYFNKKYSRVGHLFQNRFKSIGVDDEKHLLNLVSYIHNNPVKEGLGNIDTYKWSSYKEYVYNNGLKIADTDFILNFFGENRDKAIKRFIEYNSKIDEKSYLEAKLSVESKITDEEAIMYIKKVMRLENIFIINNYNKNIRDFYIYKISQIEGLYNKQIARILGISERNLFRIIKKAKANLSDYELK